ncbi:S8 family peptidase [Actinophytocola oryzae]|uniref:Peptidase inhibitor I9 n=1 Tax=Actinophytocola oryzae TaxID=502181 RepID=A0A4R7UT66_9PSEU|nr:S8 family peptidase [Actinophytocola oryzae]TDV39823.1 peptidase inhibitor I9 [Actinophytocola oryzae]
MNLRKLIARVGVACLVTALWAAPAEAAVERAYIVVLNGDVGAYTHRFESVEHVYTAALHGFSVRLSEKEAETLAGESGVDMVVPDTPVHALGEQPNPPSWGLDRIDQHDLPLDAVYRYPNEAPDVTAYVIDTGVRPTHQDFGGRVLPGHDFVDDDTDASDGNGHGTFVAGIIGGTRFGVAKRIGIVPVKVLGDNGAGTIADVIAGIDWVTANAAGPSVANLSLGGSPNTALDEAVRNSIASGVTYAVAAGGSGTDAGNFSPARVVEALTIGASDSRDCLPSNTNRGSVVDMFAPGVNIVGPVSTTDTAFATFSGSSFSAPHVAGAAGIYLEDHPTASAAEVSAALVAASTRDRLCNVPAGTANRLLFVG